MEHMNVFNGFLDQLRKVDVKIDEEDKALLLLTSLPDSYDILVTTFLYGKDTTSLEQVQLALVLIVLKKFQVLRVEKIRHLLFKVRSGEGNLMVDPEGTTGRGLVPKERVYNATIAKNLAM